MKTPLNATRRRRCEAIIGGYPREAVASAFDALRFRNGRNQRALLRMLTDEACEELAFRMMDDRVRTNRMNARNRQIARAS
jgi:hypothetical protein